MQEAQSIENQNIDPVQEVYTPSSSEKKRAMVMYMLFGIVMMMGKLEMNSFEYYHLKQAVGRWLSFVVFFVVFAVLFFLPGIKLLGIIPLLVLVIVWGIFLQQAWNGKYSEKKDSSSGSLQVFASIGGWLLNLFEINPHIVSSVSTIGQNSIVSPEMGNPMVDVQVDGLVNNMENPSMDLK